MIFLSTGNLAQHSYPHLKAENIVTMAAPLPPPWPKPSQNYIKTKFSQERKICLIAKVSGHCFDAAATKLTNNHFKNSHL